MANIWITGATGQLGEELQKRRFSPLDELFFTGSKDVDITNKSAIESFVKEHSIDTIVNCSAYTAVDRAEEEPEMAERVNRDGAANLAAISLKEGCFLIQISTDYVFDGTGNRPYTEKEHVNPQTCYGRTKLEGERAIRKSGCLYIIIRTSWLYSPYGHNFVKTILRLAQERDEISVVDDQYGSPTYAGDLADAIATILGSDDLPQYEGIYHYSNEGECSWFDFASEIVKLSGYRCKVKRIDSSLYPTKAVRPHYSVLDKTKIKSCFNLTIERWEEALRRSFPTIISQ